MQSENASAAATATCLRASTPVARGSNRTMGKRCATGHCFRTADTCSDARRASGSPLYAFATAFWMFCVLELPWCALPKHRFFKKQVNAGDCLKKLHVKTDSALLRFNSLASAYLAHSNRPCALHPVPQSQPVSPYKPDRRPCRNADAPAGLAERPRA
jgi:hypothetical protein